MSTVNPMQTLIAEQVRYFDPARVRAARSTTPTEARANEIRASRKRHLLLNVAGVRKEKASKSE